MQHSTSVYKSIHFQSSYLSYITKGVLATYSSSRCRCDSTMVTGKCVGGVGRDQFVEGESCAAAALSSVRRWAVLIQATRARMSCVLQWQAVGFVQTKRLRLREGERRNLPPNCLTPGTREVESLQTSHQPSLHCIWRGEREGKSALGMHDR